MEELFWFLNANSHFELVSPMAMPLLLGFVLYQSHYILVVGRNLLLRALHGTSAPLPPPGQRPSAIITMPTLLRSADELDGLKGAILSAVNNGYPGTLHVVAAIDDGVTHKALYAALEAWMSTLTLPANVHVYACCTSVRRGKAVAIDEAVRFMKARVERGLLAVFPPIFFNMDADSELGPHALTRLVDTLLRPSRWTNQRRGIVTANVGIARDAYWRGWREFFTVRGQLSVHVAAEFLTSLTMGRFNWKVHPVPGASGALYCTWSEIHLVAPRWAAFMQTVTFRSWLAWLFGAAPPCFATADVTELPEATTGPGDDTWVTWLAFCARWVDGKMTLEFPRTPAHAFAYFVRSYFFRGLAYDIEARVSTNTPTTVKALFKQRVRWNTSRIELSQRWTPALAFHWTAGFPAVISTAIIVYYNATATLAVVTIPFSKLSVSVASIVLLLAFQTLLRAVCTFVALALDGGLRTHAPKLLGTLLAVPYHFVFNKLTTMVGYVQDVFLFGVNTNFAPEATHIKSGLPRFALAYRVRRALYLAFRAVIYNDVPLGTFWFGWQETPWTPNGFEGWSTGKRRVLRARTVTTTTEIAAPVAPAVVAAAAVVTRVATVTSLLPRSRPRPSLVPSLPPSGGPQTIGALTLPSSVRKAA